MPALPPSLPALPARRGPARSAIVQGALFVLTAALVLAPALPVLVQAFADRALYEPGAQPSLGALRRLLTDPALRGVLADTVVFSLGATVVAQVTGIAAALLIGRTDLPGRRVFGVVILWPLYVSHLIFAMGWIVAWGPAGLMTQIVAGATGGAAPWSLYSMGGMILVAGLSQAPLAYVYCLYGAVRGVDPTLEAAARSVGAGPWGVLRRVTLPLMVPAMVGSAALNLVIALETLSIPLFLGTPARIGTLSSFLYDQGIAAVRPDHALIAASSALLVVMVAATLVLQRAILAGGHRFETVRGKASRPGTLSLGRARWPAAMAVGAVLGLGVVLPVAGLVLRAFTRVLSPHIPLAQSLTLTNFERLLSSPAHLRAIGNTLGISLAAAVIGTLLAAAIALTVQRSEFRAGRLLEALAYLPRVVPGLIVGLGVFYAAVLLPPLGWLRGTPAILVLAYVAAALPLALGVIQPAIVQINADLDRAARTAGADWLASMRLVMLPLLRPALLGAFVLLMTGFMKSYVIAVFLMAPGLEVMGVSMLNLWTNGEVGVTAAMATVQIVLMSAVLLLARVVMGVRRDG